MDDKGFAKGAAEEAFTMHPDIQMCGNPAAAYRHETSARKQKTATGQGTVAV
ncbi:hypothetical protein [Acidovorax sp. DW039]|uniref:hypothetical protein n=1 Tax=Acidovorax sp. DW039 TaxID=3095606 RepID=UPI0030D5F8D0